MRCFRRVQCPVLASLLLLLASSTQAIPIKFEFTGTVTDKILSNSQMIDVEFHARKWKGKTVTGSMIIDLDGLATRPNQDPEQSYYSSSWGDNPADWLSFTITNPDGNTYSIPGGYDPLPEVDVDASTAYLIDSVLNGTHLYVGRTYTNLRSLPKLDLSLRLQGSGIYAKQAITSKDFNTVEFNPEFANRENYGIVRYFDDDGRKIDYHFTITSITRVPFMVPESAGWVLILGGLMGILLRRKISIQQTYRKNHGVTG